MIIIVNYWIILVGTEWIRNPRTVEAARSNYTY